MIKIKIHREKKNGKIVYFKISGHSEAADYGEDIICSAVSSVSQMTLNGLIEILKLDKINYEIDEGLIVCDLKPSNLTEEEYDKTHILTESMYSYLKDVAENYKKNVKLVIKEV